MSREGVGMDMKCDICGNFGIYWKNLCGVSPYTYCPHCEQTNCQVPELQEDEDEGATP